MATNSAFVEVVADFREALNDLRRNDRYEINNLTVIAKENIDAAEHLSHELESHIRTTPGPRKLVALYVLDSIAKNVGSPYTIFLSRNLYSTFMDAYCAVEPNTRKQMEAMLKTWREPLPQSMDPKPVFPVDSTKPIENALNRARANFQMQARTQQPVHGLPARPPSVGLSSQWEHLGASNPHSPSPQSNAFPYGTPPPSTNGFQQQVQHQSNPLQFYQQLPAAPTPQSAHQYSADRPPQSAQSNFQYSDAQSLSEQVKRLIGPAQAEWEKNRYSPDLSTKLKALLDLETILARNQLTSNELQLIRANVTRLSNMQPTQESSQTRTRPMSNGNAHQQQQSQYYQATAPQPFSTPPIPQTTPQQFQQPQHQQQPTPPLPQQQQNQLPFSSTDLAAVLALAQPKTQSATPPVTSQAPHAPPQTANNSGGSADLFANLRAMGMLPAAPTPPKVHSRSASQQGTAFPPPPATVTHSALLDLQARLGKPPPKNDVQLKPQSIKVPRPQLISVLYAKQSTQCMSCGRRFSSTDAGKARKARHLDYHFRTNQRLGDEARRGITRSWFMDEMEWIRYRELDDADEGYDDKKAPGDSKTDENADAKDQAAKKRTYIKAPADAAGGGYTCPICQEPFETTWHEEAQDWVWMDTIKIGSRVFHASCHAEVAKTSSATNSSAIRSPTLGKRKAEEDVGVGKKAKIEGIA